MLESNFNEEDINLFEEHYDEFVEFSIYLEK